MLISFWRCSYEIVKGIMLKLKFIFIPNLMGSICFLRPIYFVHFFRPFFLKTFFADIFFNVWGQPPFVIFVTRFFGTIFQKDFWRGLFFCIYFFCRQTCWTNVILSWTFFASKLWAPWIKNKWIFFIQTFFLYISFFWK